MSINEYIAKQFANPRGLGGRVVTAVMNRQNAEMYDATEALLHSQSHDVILDIGCGNGIMMERLAHTCDCRLIGTDISEDALGIARRRLAGKQVEFLCCPANSMLIADATIDRAFTVNTIYFWDDLTKGFEEIARVLKPGGIFIGTHYTNRSLDAYPHTQFGYRKYADTEVVSAAQGAGFSVEVNPIMNGRAYCLICKRA